MLRSIVGSLRSSDFGSGGGDSEIPICTLLLSNLIGKNGREQCLAGSFSGAEPSQKVTEGPIKVSLARMETAPDVQKHKLA